MKSALQSMPLFFHLRKSMFCKAGTLVQQSSKCQQTSSHCSKSLLYIEYSYSLQDSVSITFSQDRQSGDKAQPLLWSVATAQKTSKMVLTCIQMPTLLISINFHHSITNKRKEKRASEVEGMMATPRQMPPGLSPLRGGHLCISVNWESAESYTSLFSHPLRGPCVV